MSWDLNILRQEVVKQYGQEQLDKLDPCLNSIAERLAFSRLYFQKSKVALDKDLHDKTDKASLFKLVLPYESEERKEFEECKFIARAHILSCIQNIHCTTDILSHVIYYSLKLDNASKERDINLKNVKHWLRGDIECDSLRKMIDELISHDDYKYLVALVNHSKHRSIIEPYFNVNLRKQGRDMQEMRFRRFSFNRKEHPSRHVFKFIESEYERESSQIINIGNEINRIVQKNVD
jgi:hypothetical protein